MKSHSAQAIWGAALGSLQVEVTRHNFDTWFRDTVGLDYGPGRLVVGVPSPFVAETLERRMAPLVVKTLKSLVHQDVQVTFQVTQPGASSPGQGDPPLALRPPMPPTSPTRPPRNGEGCLNPRYTFDAFVVGKSNQFAHAAAVAVAENPGHAYNPLVLHAGVGLGKTHLLHAIGHAACARGLNVLYVSAEQFTNDFVSAIRENRAEKFRGKYRSLDVFLIDDIQFIAGKDHSRESFFHTFNDLYSNSKQIVITSDTRPRSIPLLEERLSSRLEGGLTADIRQPDLETRMAILLKKAEEHETPLAQTVVDFIARKVVRNVRELEGALNRILAMAKLADRPVDLDLATKAVADISSAPSRSRRVPPDVVIQTTAAYYQLTPAQLISKTRKKEIAFARQVAAYLLREDTDRSLADIGSLLGERGHTTALRAHDKIAYETNMDGDLRRQIGEIRDAIDRAQIRTG